MATLENITTVYKVVFCSLDNMDTLDLYPYANVKEKYSWWYFGMKIKEVFQNDPVIAVIGMLFYLLILTFGNR